MRTRPTSVTVLVLSLLLPGAVVLAAAPATSTAVVQDVTPSDSGSSYRPCWAAPHQGHKCEDRTVTLDSGQVRYAVKYTACVDPSHPTSRGFEEGYIGMPSPSAANWYHSGFLFIAINGKEIGESPLTDMQVSERGARGGLQMVWDTPDATVGLRFVVIANSDRLNAEVRWLPKPGATVKTVALKLMCYPSFFTSHNHRQGDRHVITPRIDKREPETLELVPAQDTYLYYCDTIFDVAKGEGDGPCAAMFLPDEITAGKVQIGGYGIATHLTVAPEAKRIRLAFWDFTGKTNAEAAARLKADAAGVQKELAAMEFRPESVTRLDLERVKTETAQYLAQAGEDGAPYRRQIEESLKRMMELKPQGDAGDWNADSELANALSDFDAVLCKLRIQALLNASRP